ncbi:MAG: HRDC domain-containing protein [Deltaproteobacteria bacterium]|nr:HRDC domain-containing protein [Deltaproteobacteria bacterium]MBW2072541.1 HRDC domain-containing protein [Deltaproteobacteria bacterium]
MDRPVLIDSQDLLQHFLERHKGLEKLALDTETNSFYAYTPRICLIQLTTHTGDYILDPLAVRELSGLGILLADNKVEKIIHAAENDLAGLWRDFRFRVRNIFDTAIACRLLGRKRLGLSRILLEEFNVNHDKKLQRCDWQKRPLSEEQLAYAQLDTHFLIPLRDRLYQQLEEKGLWQTAAARFRRLENFQPKPLKTWDPNGYLHIKGCHSLPPASLETLKKLYRYRQRLARKRNKAPFRIMGNEVLLRLAREMPQNRHSLAKIKGLPVHFKGKNGAGLLRILRKST